MPRHLRKCVEILKWGCIFNQMPGICSQMMQNLSIMKQIMRHLRQMDARKWLPEMGENEKMARQKVQIGMPECLGI